MIDSSLSASLQDFIAGIHSQYPGAELCFAAKNLVTARELYYGPDTELECASIVKIFLAYFFYSERAKDLAERVEVSAELKHSLYGAGVLKYFSNDCSICYQDLIVLMLCLSDNIATNLIIDELGGVSAVSDLMKNKLGIHSPGLVQKISNPLKDSGSLSLLRAKDSIYFFEQIESIADQFASNSLIDCMQKTTSLGNDRLARYLPVQLFAPDSKAVIASKGGTFTRPEVTCDLLYLREPDSGPLVLFAHTRGLNDSSGLPRSHIDHAANKVLATLGALIYEDFRKL